MKSVFFHFLSSSHSSHLFPELRCSSFVHDPPTTSSLSLSLSLFLSLFLSFSPPRSEASSAFPLNKNSRQHIEAHPWGSSVQCTESLRQGPFSRCLLLMFPLIMCPCGVSLFPDSEIMFHLRHSLLVALNNSISLSLYHSISTSL